jgi:ubiquinone/menaquinone biosynthesis C-methylase UbiE
MDIKNSNNINKESWDAYQDDYMRFHLMKFPDYYEFFANGGIRLDDYLIDMIGDVKGLKLFDTCCACDAMQAFSWHNLGARVTACDITPSAIRIAKENAGKMNLAVDFTVDDMQTLNSVKDNEFDIVFASYPVWVSDINAACLTWRRILKKGGRLLLHAEHPFACCFDIYSREGGQVSDSQLTILKSYNKPSVEKYDVFNGTPLADRFGGWSAELPSVENFWRISDILNAICDAGFTISKIYEDAYAGKESALKNLPDYFVALAVK